MNPPSAIHGAMGRERKPFTYTPGGLNLSEIKSERMAKRLMRNAMNQGVSELLPPPIQSPSTPTNPIAVPNFNALPVQVFPTFQLPANPKSLLRTRSTPDKPKEPQIATMRNTPVPNTSNFQLSGMDQLREALNNNTPAYTPTITNSYSNEKPRILLEFNNNRPSSINSAAQNLSYESVKTAHGSNAFTSSILPEISYDAEFCQFTPNSNNGVNIINKEITVKDILDTSLYNKDYVETKAEPSIEPRIDTVSTNDIGHNVIEDHEKTDNDDQKVKVIKKQVRKTENNTDSEGLNQNCSQNGDSEAGMTVKLPTKKTAAKTETKVEVVTKTLPDGSLEETKTTITKTTVDGKTTIATKTETKIIPQEEEEEEEQEEEEIEEEIDEDDVVVQKAEENGQQEEPTTILIKKTAPQEIPAVKETIVKKEESSSTLSTKKVVVEKNDEEEEEEVVVKKEQMEQQEEKKQEIHEAPKLLQKPEVKEEEVGEEEEIEEEEEVEEETPPAKPELAKHVEEEEGEEVDEEEEYEEAEETEDKTKPKLEQKPEPEPEQKESEEEKVAEESEYTEEEVESEKEELSKEASAPVAGPTPAQILAPVPALAQAPPPASAPTSSPVLSSVPTPVPETPKVEPKKVEAKIEGKGETKEQTIYQSASQSEYKVPLREQSIPLEKVEDVEIKPIGSTSETISKTHAEETKIVGGFSDKSTGSLSTQTEYNRIENIVTVNRTTKTLDHQYEQITQQGIPTVRTYFAPGRERVSTSPQPSKPYQPVYTPSYSQSQPQEERRHSLLLERLSTERQMPSDIYHKQTSNQQQLGNQNYEQQRHCSQEPQSEIVNDPNVKPSEITNQQWYQQSKKENVIYNNVMPSPAVPSQQWGQPQSQPQPQQGHHQQPYEIYTDNSLQHDTSKFITNNYLQNNYPSYSPAANNWISSNDSSLSNVKTQSNHYSFSNKTSLENNQNNSQLYSSTYVPPPWEQDPNFVAPQLPTQNYYQQQSQPPSTNIFSPPAKPGWKPTPPAGKFSEHVSKSYTPPVPNQSFVKTAVEPPRRSGCTTYYSEYERRYITVPESTYIPSDAKFQAQPDSSPQYYYDKIEPSEAIEHQWRKELREFTEKTQTTQTNLNQSQTQQTIHQVTEKSSVNPPWEEDPKYSKVPIGTYTSTPSWSQTLRPQSMRERSFESEFIGSTESSKANTLGRSRPLSSYGNINIETSTSERPRGVSVDRYNPNKYQSPLTIPYDSKHGPVQTHTLDPTPSPYRSGHNPNVPAYHACASTEPREQQKTTGQARNWGLDSRATPIQSRSFKYLQWITGTED